MALLAAAATAATPAAAAVPARGDDARATASARAAAPSHVATSPGRLLTARVTFDGVTPRLVVRRGGAVVLRADLGRLRTTTARRARVSATASRFSDTYATVTGKRRAHTVDATRAVLRFGAGEQIELAVADDGVAFKLSGVASQAVRYRPAAGARGWLQRLTKTYEREYQPRALRSAPAEIAYPALLTDRGRTYTLLTETAVGYGQPVEHLRRAGATLVTAPAEGAIGTTAGWRVAIIGSLADVVASDLADDFAAPSRIADTSWIKPGRVAWSWWADSWSPRRLNDQRDYVDFAERMGFEYVLVDAGWNADWVPERVHYAKARGVRVLLWTDWHALATPALRAAAFDQWADWGVAGVKADFLHSDSGERMAVIDDIAADAARHGIRLQMTFTGPAPAWATSDRKVGVRGVKAPLYGRFVRDAATHFRGRVDRYAIWNEPNWHTQLSPNKACRKNHWVRGCDAALGRLYRALYTAGHRSVKAVDPQAQVLFGEFAPQASGTPRERTAYASAPLAILREITCSKRSWKAAKRCPRLIADGFAQHPYGFTAAPDRAVGRADDVMLATLDRLTAALDKLAARGALRTPSGAPMELYLSEHGYLQSGDRKLPEPTRAAYLTQSFDRALAHPRVRQLLQYLLVAPPPRQDLFPTQIINRDGTLTESFAALANWSAGNAASLADVSVHRF